MFCSNCGKEVNEQEKFCRYCGETVTNSNAENQEEVKTEEKPKKKKSKKKIVLIVVVVLLLFLAIAGAKNNTSTNAVDTEIEMSDISYTGMRFNKTWSDLKLELEKRYAEQGIEFEADKAENLAEYMMLIGDQKGKQTIDFTIIFQVENKSDKIIGMYMAISQQIEDKDQDKAMEMWNDILSDFGNSTVERQKEAWNKIQNEESPICFKDNICAYITGSEDYYLFYVLASNEEEWNYFKQNEVWRIIEEHQNKNNNTTTDTNDKKNTSNNSLVEASDVSYTGMRFKKSWSEFKNQIQQYTSNISVKWEEVKPYSNKSLTEHGMLYIKYNERTKQQYVALQINFIVEDNTDKMIGMYCLVDNNSTPEDANLYWAIVILFDENVAKVGQKLLGQLQSYNGNDGWNPDVHSYFENNIFARVSYVGSNMSFYIHACNDEEAQYYRENKKWRETKGQATSDNEKTFTTAEEIAQGTTSYSANSNQNNNSTRQYLDNTTLQAKGLAKCLEQNMNIKSLLNSGDFVHKEDVTKNSDGSVSVHIGLYEKETYEYSQMYGIPIYEVAYDDVTLTKEEATR